MTSTYSRDFSQNLKEHEWKNRVVLILKNSSKNEIFENQLTVLKLNKDGLRERKIIVYSIEPTKYQRGTDPDENEFFSTKLYQKFNEQNKDFKIVLIGLDGFVKLEQSEFLPIETLFAKIDTMPVRRNELNTKQ
ncbi:MAG: DUF4174 domain-containing protein [Bacteroidota bacterium]